MSNEQPITIAGRLTEDPTLRFTPSGAAVANLTVAYNPQKFDRQANEWVKGTTHFWRCAAWNNGKLTMAENIAGLLKKGDAVIVQGVIEAREYEKDGNKRTVLEVRVQHIGKDCLFHGEPYNEPFKPAQQPAQQGWGQQQDDPWAQPQQQSGGWDSRTPAEPPF